MYKYINPQIFYIDSHEKLSGTHNDFTYQLDLKPDKPANRVVVLDASLKKSFYLIEEQRNTFTLRENLTDVIITIPEGNYSFSSFKGVLQTLLNNSSPNGWTYTVSIPNTAISASTGKYTFSCVGGNPSFIFTEYIYEQMGFLINSTNEFINNTLVSAVIVNFNKDILHIHSDIVADNRNNILVIISANSPDFSSMKYQCLDIEANSKPFVSRSNTFRFTVMDEEHRPITLSLNILMTILVYQTNDMDEQYKKMSMEYMRYKLLTNK